jgi:S-formylglutathione hydrolase FrmB
MGGHGAIFLAFRHADMFSACGSISGGVDLKSSKNRFEIKNKLGDTVNYARNWIDYSVINVIEKKPSDSLAIMVDCGINDIFIAENRALHAKMIQLKIPHDYVERMGQHDWAYWRANIEYQLFFFQRHLIISN